ncbi:hypothetical protein [Nitratireductor basaltis]|uniref:Transcriptional regulator n=1 Tax=Nitratireductor basaltis TaxID=472175 RepID=A0A084U5C2_9HYPH|nr:hypothetical protein [Nitratireductor basaltis]KFB08158.1 hypothetical protein EL18_03368 [Nitratireductor basaltis]
MSEIATKETVFRQPMSKAETKSEITDRTARAIMDAEVNARDAKTERLKAQRLAMEAKRAAEEAANPAPVKKKRVTKSRVKSA